MRGRACGGGGDQPVAPTGEGMFALRVPSGRTEKGPGRTDRGRGGAPGGVQLVGRVLLCWSPLGRRPKVGRPSLPGWAFGTSLGTSRRRVAGHPRRRKGRLTAGVVAWAAAEGNSAPGGGASETPQGRLTAGWSLGLSLRTTLAPGGGASETPQRAPHRRRGRLGCRVGQPLRRVAGHSRRRKGRLTAGVVGRRCERLPPCRQGSASAPEPSQGCRSSGVVADLRSPSSGPRPLGRPGLPRRWGWACRALPVADATAPSYGIVVDVSRRGWHGGGVGRSPSQFPQGERGEGGGRPQGAPLRKIPPARIEARFPLSRE